MLQQTQVKTVLPYWESWMQALPNIRALADVSPEKIHKLWEGLGYYTRVRNMQRAAQIIVNEHSGEFPSDFDAVLALPGIGRYTAGAICSIAFNQPTPILDGNVIRVLTRLFAIKGDPREKKTNANLWHIAEDLVKSVQNRFRSSPASRDKGTPNSSEQHDASEFTQASPSPPLEERAGERRPFHLRLTSVRWQAHSSFGRKDEGPLTSAATAQNSCSHLNQSLMELGALVCTPKNPLCPDCPLKSTCIAHRKRIVHLLPNIPRRAPATSRHFLAFVINQNARFLVRQRPAGVVNAHLWEFPNLEINGEIDPTKIAQSTLGFLPTSLKPTGTIKHTITRYRITLDVFRGVARNVRVPLSPSDGERARERGTGHWLPLRDLRRLPFSSAHKKILADL
jgi:adenine-specific DNA glycosylase